MGPINIVVSVVASIVANIVTNLTMERTPQIASWLLDAGALRLAPGARRRWREDWQEGVDDHLAENRPTEALGLAVGVYLWHARRVASEVGCGPSRVVVWCAAVMAVHYRRIRIGALINLVVSVTATASAVAWAVSTGRHIVVSDVAAVATGVIAGVTLCALMFVPIAKSRALGEIIEFTVMFREIVETPHDTDCPLADVAEMTVRDAARFYVATFDRRFGEEGA